MREAKLVGLSQDGTKLILAVAPTGEEFAVPVDDRLRAALRGDRARLGQLEIHMESALRPRDIQARIRAGESPESVAAVAQVPMERLMAFAGPVLAERDHVASLAQRASVRRRGGEGPTRNLGTWVTERLRTRQIDPAAVEWDAWRREDGRWAVRVSYSTGEDEQVAMFAYDAPGRYAVPDDDEARWLVGEQAQVTAPQSGERRLAAVSDFDASLAPDHGSDSYEAGFEDAISITRERQVTRDSGRLPHREAARDTGRNPGQESPEVAGRDSGGRDSSGRSPRRVQSVPNPDDEPTLVDVPNERPSGHRPTVRAVERPSRAPATSPEELAASGGRFTDRQQPFAPGATDPRSPRTSEQPRRGNAESDTGQAAQAERRHEPPVPAAADAPAPADADARVPADAEAAPPSDGRLAEPRPVDPAQPDSAQPDPAQPTPADLAPDQPATAGQTPAKTEGDKAAEAKKKPARRGSKRASVPSWDEIMFGKKAD